MLRLYEGLARLAGAAAIPVLRARAALGDGDARERLALAGPGANGGTLPGARPVWCHAASVGEVQALLPILDEMRRRHPDVALVVSTMTTTGRAAARERAGWARPFLFPLDVPRIARRAMERIAPRALVIAETEIWPAVIAAARSRGVPLALVNGRVSEPGFRRYRLIEPMLRASFASFRLFVMQSDADRDRIVALGAPADRVVVAGNTKVDAAVAIMHGDARAAERRRRGIPAEARLVVGGSVRPEETMILLDAFALARREHPRLLLLLAPRHLDRIAAVEAEAAARGFRTALWSAASCAAAPAGDILILDTLGELASAYGLGDIAFVGGTLDARYGGHNPLEPASHGVPVLVGPYRRNILNEAGALLASGGAREARDAASLAHAMGSWLDDEDARRAAGRKAMETVDALRGAAARTVDLLTGAGFPW